MGLEPVKGAKWRRSPVTSGPDYELDGDRLRPVHRQLSFTFHPMNRSTLCTVITTDWQGHRRWDRRAHTLTLGVGADALQGLDMAEVLRILLREALENLS